MKGIKVSEFGEPTVMKYVEDLPMPAVDEPDQVLVKVKAVGVNPVEAYIRSGAFPALPDLPYTPGYDCAGIVEAVGSAVTVVKPGDRVWTFESLSGTYAEFVKAKEYQVAPLPDELTFEDGAGLGIPYMTAYRILVVKAGVKKGETVMVHGASGGAGSASVQMAKALGCTVIGTAGTPEGIELVTKAGADKVFNHRDPNYMKEILEYASSVDVIVEMAAHANLGKDLPLLSKGGRVVIIGSKGSVEIDPSHLVMKEVSVSGVLVFASSAEEYRTAGNFIKDGGTKGWVRPIVGKRFPLAEASKAHTDIIQGSGALGRTILTLE